VTCESRLSTWVISLIYKQNIYHIINYANKPNTFSNVKLMDLLYRGPPSANITSPQNVVAGLDSVGQNVWLDSLLQWMYRIVQMVFNCQTVWPGWGYV
jgi:hypothetical protein